MLPEKLDRKEGMAHSNWSAQKPVIIGLFVCLVILLAGASVSFAALNFSGTSIQGDGPVVIDSSSTISIGTSTATGVMIGRSGGTTNIVGNLTLGSTMPGSAPASSVAVAGKSYASAYGTDSVTAPAAPIIASHCSIAGDETCSTTYAFRAAIPGESGVTLGAVSNVIANGPDTLTGSNYVSITLPPCSPSQNWYVFQEPIGAGDSNTGNYGPGLLGDSMNNLVFVVCGGTYLDTDAVENSYMEGPYGAAPTSTAYVPPLDGAGLRANGFTSSPNDSYAVFTTFAEHFGYGSAAYGVFDTAIGNNAIAVNAQSTSIGQGSFSSGQHCTNVGQNSYCTGEQGTILGDGSSAQGSRSIMVGSNTRDNGFHDVVSIGEGIIASANGQIYLGTPSMTDVWFGGNDSHGSPSTNPVTEHNGKRVVTTVSALGTCNSTYEGTDKGVTDALSPVALATVTGGGSVHVPVYCDGSKWIVE
jgi:hypothetical protein